MFEISSFVEYVIQIGAMTLPRVIPDTHIARAGQCHKSNRGFPRYPLVPPSSSAGRIHVGMLRLKLSDREAISRFCWIVGASLSTA
jgi:hypothetical protein